MGGYDQRPAIPDVVVFCLTTDPSDQARGYFETRQEEARGLVEAADLNPVITLGAFLRQPQAATLLSAGLIERASDALKETGAGLLYINNDLSPVQQRNLERRLQVKVIDRTGLILSIFASRARTQEGELQVALAQFTYQRSRLVRSWTHLERQRGGRGFLGGPGETQIEADRRAIDERIHKIKLSLDKVRQRRTSQRKKRQDAAIPLIALVGYTNAGKTTLFHRLGTSTPNGENKLFATLDPLVRRVRFGMVEALLSDTVGFIEDLPTHLIAAFQATLEEVTEADMILHVRDASNRHHEEQATAVNAILEKLGLDEVERHERIIEVWNKIDRLDEHERSLVLPEGQAEGACPTLSLSALSGEGLDRLELMIESQLIGARKQFQVSLDVSEGQALNWLHTHTLVEETSVTEEGHQTLSLTATSQLMEDFERLFRLRKPKES